MVCNYAYKLLIYVFIGMQKNQSQLIKVFLKLELAKLGQVELEAQ